MLLALILILVVARIGAIISARIGQPAVLGQLLVGIILGPTLLGVVHSTSTIADLAELGVILLMFIAGLETDLPALRKAGGQALLVATGGVLVPLIAGAIYYLKAGHDIHTALFVGTILTATSVSISAQTLMELNQLRSREGTLILGAAVIDDVIGILVLTLVIGAKSGTGGALGLVALKLGVYFALAMLIIPRILPFIIRFADRFNGSEMLLTTAFVICLILSLGAEKAGVADITGAYIAGILFGQTEVRRRISGRAQVVAYSLLTPIFFANIGLNANLRELGPVAGIALAISVIAVFGKIIGCGAVALATRAGLKESLRVGIGMISRGEVALITAAIGLQSGILSQSVYSTMVVMVLATTILTPPLLKLAFHSRGASAGQSGRELPSQSG